MSNLLCAFGAESLGASDYARATGQRLVGIPEESGTTFSDQTMSTNKNGSYHLLLLFRIPYISEEK